MSVYQVRVDLYPLIGVFPVPERKTNEFEDKGEAIRYFEEEEEKYGRNKNGYGRIVLLLREIQFTNGNKNYVKELGRLKFRIIK